MLLVPLLVMRVLSPLPISQKGRLATKQIALHRWDRVRKQPGRGWDGEQRAPGRGPESWILFWVQLAVSLSVQMV